VWPLWVLIFQGFLIWFFLNPERALSALYKVLDEALGKPKTKTLSRYGTLQVPANTPSATLPQGRNFTRKPSIRLLWRKRTGRNKDYVDNQTFSLNNLPDEVDDSTRFAVLDNSTPSEPDFFFMPLIFLESFNSPAMVLRIGEDEVTMPIDWSIAVGDSSSSNDIEILPLTSLNDRGFEAMIFNPLSSFRLEFKKIEIVNFYNDVKWYFPKMKNGQLLAVPTRFKDKPDCAYFVKEISRQSEIIQLDKIL
jgi:hypothetical protein